MSAAAEGEKVANHEKSLRTSSEKLPCTLQGKITRPSDIFFFKRRHGCYNVRDRIHFQAAGVRAPCLAASYYLPPHIKPESPTKFSHLL